MRLPKRVIAIFISALFMIGATLTAYADVSAGTYPDLWGGTERIYGWDCNEQKPVVKPSEIPESVYRTDDWAEYAKNVGDFYSVVPKNETVSVESGNSGWSASDNMEIHWVSLGANRLPDGRVYLFHDSEWNKTEKLEFGKEYQILPDGIESAIEWSASYSLPEFKDTPFMLIVVDNYTKNAEWIYTYQLTDDWKPPVASDNSTNTASSTWASDSKGWWIQNADGTYLTNTWYQSPDSGLWYYMGADGYMLTNTTTTYGYTVNADGVWVQ